ncbi:endoglucanase [Sporomusaceae bacterium BoRhaA]|uniref:glycoside hydrolase family 9 protein n=1 Tax=Pelorhabdus rhamnosifermentans TaxID=2772457 RepID=UPI001C061F13|nr:glycoside hydrolase family 9 protein [Pelorhabdus rhamnosifermentans]MBU2703844.1 endoglucanase [Pelorhabdus rhamnosifermentans]
MRMKNSFNKMLGFGIVVLLVLCTAFPVFANAVNATDAKIHVDQVGYLPEYPKVAIVVAANNTDEFKVINTDTNEIVYKGILSVPRKDISSGDTVRKADFSTVTTPGTYLVTVDGIGSSYKFKIGSNIYYIPLIHTLRSFTLARCNIAMNDPITGLKHAVDHEKAKRAKVFFSDDVSTKGDVLDVTGGWWDAGDYGKYVPTGGITVANILLAYEAQPEKFKKDQMFFPDGIAIDESAPNMPDVLVEMKCELDWMLKMQRSDGAVYLKTAGAYWSDLNTRPEAENYNQYVYGLATYNTALFGAANAMAARIYQKYDSNYAAQLLDAAKKAFAYLKDHPEPSFRFDEGQNKGSGPYEKTTENEQHLWLASVKKEYPTLNLAADTEERIWLSAELFKTTGDKEYEQYLKDHFSDVIIIKPKAFSWTNSLALGQWAYITNPNAENLLKEKVKHAFLEYADSTVKQIAADGYNCALNKNEYTWASNKVTMSKANMLVLAYQLDPKSSYLNAALDQVHYALGRNTNGVCYLTGSGTNPTRNVHNRLRVSTGIYIPGWLTGGPNNWPNGDPVQAQLIAKGNVPPAKAYIDVSESYSTNENDIDYTAPMTYMLAYFSTPNDKLTSEEIKISVNK